MKIELTKQEIQDIMEGVLNEKYRGIVPEGYELDISFPYSGGAEIYITKPAKPKVQEVAV